jgi:hypothetical protein
METFRVTAIQPAEQVSIRPVGIVPPSRSYSVPSPIYDINSVSEVITDWVSVVLINPMMMAAHLRKQFAAFIDGWEAPGMDEYDKL